MITEGYPPGTAKKQRQLSKISYKYYIAYKLTQQEYIERREVKEKMLQEQKPN